ncbi:hypothetical protein [Aquihabitans sp. McL0605]|uniref:hypothetical protein n=1 Tax=Aquihabitans sp. McL0605 TaxID=3415671 RepID=UPI003CFBADFA
MVLQRHQAMFLDIHVFEAPTSFCGEFASATFTHQLDGVEHTEGADLRATVATVRAGFLRQTAALASTPAPDAAQIRRLAAAVVSGERSDDFGAARTLARSLDADATERCS